MEANSFNNKIFLPTKKSVNCHAGMSVNNPFRLTGGPAGESQPDGGFKIKSAYTIHFSIIITNPSFKQKIIKEEAVVNTSANDDHCNSF